MNLSHHSEQIEAARLDFRKLWEGKLQERAMNLAKIPHPPAVLDADDCRVLCFAEDIAWQAFIHALNIRGEL